VKTVSNIHPKDVTGGKAMIIGHIELEDKQIKVYLTATLEWTTLQDDGHKFDNGGEAESYMTILEAA
jgi:hypothetical protein